MQIFGAVPWETRTRLGQGGNGESGRDVWFGLEVIQACNPHRALRPLREPSSGGLTLPVCARCSKRLASRNTIRAAVRPRPSLLETSLRHDSSLSNSMETWLTHGGAVEAGKEVVEIRGRSSIYSWSRPCTFNSFIPLRISGPSLKVLLRNRIRITRGQYDSMNESDTYLNSSSSPLCSLGLFEEKKKPHLIGPQCRRG